MTCDEFRAGFLAGELDEGQPHLDGCGECRARLADLVTTRAMLAEPAMWEQPGTQLEDTVVSLVAAAAGTSGDPEGGPSGGIDGGAVSARRWRILGIAAVIVALVAVAGVLLAQRSDAPDWEATMHGTTAAPDASAEVAGWMDDTGTRLVLTIEGLDPAPAGYIYEMWLSEANIHVSAGTFIGGETIELWSGVARGDFPRLWVTLEPVDDDESPSSTTVLDT